MATDPGDELVDIVDADDHVVAVVARRRMRAQRLRHRAVYIVVSGSDGRVLVHQRSWDKDLWPGWWDIAVGGVVGAGEGYEEAARRELAEEVGVRPLELRGLGGGAFRDETCDVMARCFHVVEDGPFAFADGEVIEARWAGADQVVELVASGTVVPDSLALLGATVFSLLRISDHPVGGVARGDPAHEDRTQP